MRQPAATTQGDHRCGLADGNANPDTVVEISTSVRRRTSKLVRVSTTSSPRLINLVGGLRGDITDLIGYEVSGGYDLPASASSVRAVSLVSIAFSSR